MLILTPTPLQTAAERALFAELAGWDSGGGVRGGVMASLPLVEGPMQRRQADAVLFVPEGVAMVRVVEVERQAGVVTTNPEGAWTIGPGDGPGDVLQLAGGGSTPLEGLMRAGMHAAVTLRKAGLEPGRIARLTVLTGQVTGLVPADGDLGEGDQVALVDSRSLLLGVARASRHAGTDNPRLWTTADVRAAIEALGVAGRTPSVEELNVEGFPYSPYVLRRPDLLTPAAMNAGPGRPAAPIVGAMGGPATGATPAAAPERAGSAGPLVDPAAAARVAAAAVQAQEAQEEAERAASSPVAAQQTPPEQTPPQQAPTHQAPTQQAPTYQEPTYQAPAPQTATSYAPAAQPHAPAAHQATVPVELRSAAARDTVAPAYEPGVVGPRAAPDDTDGLGGLFTGGPTATEAPRLRRELPPELQPRPPASPPAAPWGRPPAEHRSGAPRGRTALLVLAVLGVLLVVGIGIWAATRDPDGDGSGGTAATSSAPPAPTTSAGPVVGDTAVVDGTTFTLQAVQVDETCQGHAYDAVAAFFASSDCTELTRSLWSADADGRPAVVSVSQVVMPDVASAQALRSLADTDGSGNVSDLLREGVRYEGGPTRLSGAEYASASDGTTTTIVETSWTGAAGSTSALDALASNGLSLDATGTD